MKTLIAIVLALGVGFAGAYVIVTKEKNAELAKLQQTPQVQQTPEAVDTPAQKVIVKTVAGAPAGEAPQDILNDLLNIRLGATSSERNTALRTVVFKLESLSQCGATAVPATRSFIGRSVDMNYEQQDTQNQNNNNQGNGGGGNQFGNGGGGQGGFGGFRGGARRARNLQSLQTDWVVPPSLRLGLVSTLKEIGGTDAEQALGDMLNSTGRGVEVAYLTVVLEDMAPTKHRADAIKAAKDLLMNPVAINSPDRLDDLSKSYLYGVLEFYNDTSFAPNAQQMLVGADGRLDQDAMDYLSTVLKDQSVAALYSAYNNSSLTNQFDKRRLGRDILNYVGQNPQANQLFTQTLNNPDVEDRMKIFSIAQLAGGFGGGGDNLNDAQVISQRIAYLQSIASQYANNRTSSQALAATIKALQSGEPVDMGNLFGQGGGGQRRNRNGG